MFLETTIISFIVVKIRKGRLEYLENTVIRAWYLLILAALIQGVLVFFNRFDFTVGNYIFENYFFHLHFLSYILMLVCIILNINKHFMKLFFIGLILNFIVIFANGGQMPVSIEGRKGIKNPSSIELPISDFNIKHKSLDKNTRLVYLADIILIPEPYPFPKVISIGDIFLILGVFVFSQEAMVVKKRRKPKVLSQF